MGNMIGDFLDFMFDDGEVFEVCAIGTKPGKYKILDNEYVGQKSTVAGWFDDKKKAVEYIERYDKEVKPVGIYVTLNPCNPALLGRVNNRLSVVKSRTSDKDIVEVKHLLIDVDPQRPADTSASDEELISAKKISNSIYTDLTKRGWPSPFCGESGNGYHFIYKVDGVDSALIKEFLNGLSSRFSNGAAKIDTSVFNPARLVKVYGTTTRKGDEFETRKHRRSNSRSIPKIKTAVKPDMLAPFITEPEEKPRRDNGGDFTLDVESYLRDHGIECLGNKRHGSATLYQLANCVFDESHANNEAAIGQTDDGKLFYQCFHNSCQGKTWHEARYIISGDEILTSKTSNTSKASTTSNASDYKQITSNRQARDKQDKISPTLYNDIKEWVTEKEGTFNTYDIDREFSLYSREEKNVRSQVLNNLKKQGVIDHKGSRRGEWRTLDTDLELMDVFGAASTTVSLPFPVGICDLVKLYPKSIVVIAGEQNAGKSACTSTLLYNIYINNNKYILESNLGVDNIETYYFNSEMSEEELKERWMKFPQPELFRNVRAVSRSGNFQDVIKPNAINVIDYLEIFDSFWEVGGIIKQIHDKLDRGIAVICIQKAPGSNIDLGRGGSFSLEKPRLYIAMKNNVPYGGIMKIVKAKAFVDPKKNPNGMELDYALIDGWKFKAKSDWRHVTEEERRKINREYAKRVDGWHEPVV